ncbi:MAG: type III-A CRISPR-associated protein Csm2 [Bacteroidia bacterium]
MAYKNHYRDDDDPAFQRDFVRDFKSTWIKSKIDKDGIKFCDDLGKFIARKGMTTSQIRNFFGEVKRIQMKRFEKEETAFLLLKPKLAYAAKRAKNPAVEKFQKVMDLSHDAVDEGNAVHFNNFVNLLEAILAYHKSHGGRD